MRLAPLRPETTWRLEGDDLVELSGRRQRRWSLSTLRRLRLASQAGGRRAVLLEFPRGRASIVSHGWAGLGRFEDRTASFAVLVRALAARAADLAPGARFGVAGVAAHEAFFWAMGLIGIGAAALLLFSLTAGAAAMGLALAARMVFVLLLMLAVLPWLTARAPAIDPRAIPASLLPEA